MEGAISNQPGGFSYSSRFGFSGSRINLARYKFSLSTCSGCHNADTGTPFQMVRSSGQEAEAFFAQFMVGGRNRKGNPFIVNDQENALEKHEFFDLKAREDIVRDILSVASQVESSRLQLTRTELDANNSSKLAEVFVHGGVTAQWEFELPLNRLDNDRFQLNELGELFYSADQPFPQAGAWQIVLRAKALDNTGYVIERPYNLWVLMRVKIGQPKT